MKIKLPAWLLLFAMLLICFAGCGGTAVSEPSASTEASAVDSGQASAAEEEAVSVEEPAQVEGPISAEEAPETSTEEEAEAAEPEVEEPTGTDALFDYELPITTDSPEYTFLLGFNPGVSSFIEGFEENQVMQEWMARTGINMTFNSVHPSTAAEQFNLFLAAGDLPDVTDNGLNYYNGSTTNTIEDGYFADLNQYADACPNYMTTIGASPMIKKALTTDEGYIAAFYQLQVDTVSGEGMMIRKDWLDAAGLDIPETYDEVYEVLKAFQSRGAISPMLLNNSGTWSNGAFGFGYDMNGYMTTDPMLSLPLYVVDGEVRFAMMEQEYVDYLTMISGWYAEGLIAQDIENISMFQMCTDRVINGETGYFYSASNMLSNYQDQAAEDGFELVAAPQPVRNQGDEIHFGGTSFEFEGRPAGAAVNSWAVNAAAEEIETLITCLDYLYSPEGTLLANYGVEGISFEYVDGKPMYTSLITNNDQGMTMDNAVYIYSLQYGAFREDYNRHLDVASDEVRACADVWTVSPADNYSYPIDFVFLTTEESDVYASLFSDISTVIEENILKFITGTNSMDDYPAFQQQLADMGIDQIVDIYQAAYDRFMAR